MNGSSTKPLSSTEICLFLLTSDYDRQSLHGYFVACVVIMSLFIIPTILLNGLVLAGIWKCRPLHTPANVLLCGLAASDLGAGALVMPIFIANSISYSENILPLWCKARILTNLLAPFFAGISFATITLVSVDRMIALKFHLRYASVVTNTRIFRALIALWFTGLVLSSAYLWYVRLLHWATVVVFSFCLALCTFNNASVLTILRRHRVAINRLQVQIQANQSGPDDINMAQRRKTSSNMLWVYGLFILCYAPFLVVRIFKNFANGHTKASFIAFTFTYFMVYANSLLNPILYCMKMRAVRKAMLILLPHCIQTCLKEPSPALGNNVKQPIS